ncbi:MAG: hypothetical protein QNJ44_09890 [Rhodobacter sp.]|nr:hypothetical protein [Rhodobacter sp.]
MSAPMNEPLDLAPAGGSAGPAVERIGGLDLLERAARGVGKVDHLGPRGALSVSAEEIEAMALVLAILNFPQLAPAERPADPAGFFRKGLREMAGNVVGLGAIGGQAAATGTDASQQSTQGGSA